MIGAFVWMAVNSAMAGYFRKTPHYSAGRLLVAVCALSLFAIDPLIRQAAAFCEYGALPGFWDGERYELVNQECNLDRLIERWSSLRGAIRGESILLIGDSFDRQCPSPTLMQPPP